MKAPETTGALSIAEELIRDGHDTAADPIPEMLWRLKRRAANSEDLAWAEEVFLTMGIAAPDTP